MASQQTGIVWFRNDLRLHDHRPLNDAAQTCGALLPVVIIDPRQWRWLPLGFAKTGPYRTRFLEDSIRSLQQTLQALDRDLLMLRGHPEELLPRLIQATGATHLYFSHEPTTEEQAVETRLREACQPTGVQLHTTWQKSLIHPDDLPFAPTELPDVFSRFRKQVERHLRIAPPLEPPTSLPPVPRLDWSAWPVATPGPGEKALPFQGGEAAGLQRLRYYLWDSHLVSRYKQTRNGLLGQDYSSKFSPWLANGCLSPRRVVAELRQYEARVTRNESTYWLLFELLWRDYFSLLPLSCGDRLFYSRGLKPHPIEWKQDKALFRQWCQGQTGVPFIDANMTELNQTGYMSNRGRQNVANYLSKGLGIDWRWGAAYFESLLIDYDVTSNWGNWAYNAGVGNDLRENRLFNIEKQTSRYDPEGAYVQHWLTKGAQASGQTWE